MSLDSLLDSILNDSSAGESSLAEQLCAEVASLMPELQLNQTAYDLYMQDCIAKLNSSAETTSSSTTSHSEVIIVIIYCLLAAGCLLGNLVVLLVILLNKTMRRSITNIMVINLAVADFGVGVFTSVQAFFESSLVSQSGMYDKAPDLCKFQQVLQLTMLMATVIILLLICVDRYMAILYPMSQRQHRKKQWYVIVACGGWLFALIFGLPNVYFYEYNSSSQMCYVSQQMLDYFHAYYWISAVLLFAIPLVVMSVAYGRVAASLLNSINQFNVEYSVKGDGEMATTTVVTANEASETVAETKETSKMADNADQKAKKLTKQSTKKSSESTKSKMHNPASARRRTVQMFITIVVAFFVCKLPKTIYVMILLTSPSTISLSSSLDMVVVAIYMLYLLPSAINPAMYFLFSKQYRTALWDLLHCNT